MFNLKNVYFYLLAVKIVITKITREFYFKTNFYIKSLKTKIPEKIVKDLNSYIDKTIEDEKKSVSKPN